MTKNRVFYFDALRAMAIIGIVFCHVSVPFVSQNLNNSNLYAVAFFDCFRDFSIPIFVMLSGILLLNRTESFKIFFKKRLSRLLIPFVFWAIIYILYSSDFTLSNICNIFFGQSGTLGVTFWFIWMIILMYIGIFIINKAVSFLNESSKDKFFYLLTMFSLIYFTIIHFDLFSPFVSKIVYFASFITYIIIGYFIANYSFIGEKINGHKVVFLTLIASVLSYCYYVFGVVVPGSFNAHAFVISSYFNFLLLFISINVFVLFKYLSKSRIMDKIENSHVGNAVILISKYSFGIYLVHYLIIDILRYNFLIHMTSPNPLIWIPLIVIVTLIICLLILWVLSQIPYLNKFSGVN